MSERIRFFEEAADDVEQERAWYRSRSEIAEASFLRELDQAIDAPGTPASVAPEKPPACR